MLRTKEELARIHLETAIALVGIATVSSYLTNDPPTENPSTTPPSGKTRGRKPGAAPEESRCIWKLSSGDQCKNTKLEGRTHCKIHTSKADAISAAALTENASASSSESSPSA
jgi:hypothetical protein